jgi:hypothetical protein
MTTKQLIDQLVTEGGAIVTSGECSEMEIADAQATGRFSVREDGIGFVRRYAEWLALQLEREKDPKGALAIEIEELKHRVKEVEADNAVYRATRKGYQAVSAKYGEVMAVMRTGSDAEKMVAEVRAILFHNV